MATLVHHPLTNCQDVPYLSQRAERVRSGLFARIGETLRTWYALAEERQELAQLSERELHDMGASSADVWNETNQWFWRTTHPF